MGKRLDQLNGLEDGPSARDGLAEQREAAEDVLADVTQMLDSGRYDFAWGFLQDLQRTLQRTERVTKAQIEAVDNIRRGGDMHEERKEGWDRHEARTGRRYEGWTGGGSGGGRRRW